MPADAREAPQPFRGAYGAWSRKLCLGSHIHNVHGDRTVWELRLLGHGACPSYDMGSRKLSSHGQQLECMELSSVSFMTLGLQLCMMHVVRDVKIYLSRALWDRYDGIEWAWQDCDRREV